MNASAVADRAKYEDLKDQLDLIVQDEAFFEYDDESGFIKYVEDTNHDKQGIKVRMRFSDTVEKAKELVSEAVGD